MFNQRALPVCLDYEAKHTTVYAAPGGSSAAAGLKRIRMILFKCVDYKTASLSRQNGPGIAGAFGAV